jgi:hypothetical protein
MMDKGVINSWVMLSIKSYLSPDNFFLSPQATQRVNKRECNDKNGQQPEKIAGTYRQLDDLYQG